MHCSENCQSETSSIVNNREQFVEKDRWKYQFTKKRSMWKFQSVSFFFRCKVEVRWRIAGLFLYCLLDYPSHGQEQTGFCVLGLGTTLLALQRGWKSCKSILCQSSLPLVLLVAGEESLIYLKCLKPWFIFSLQKEGEKINESEAQGCKYNVLFSLWRSASDFSWLIWSCSCLPQI